MGLWLIGIRSFIGKCSYGDSILFVTNYYEGLDIVLEFNSLGG